VKFFLAIIVSGNHTPGSTSCSTLPSASPAHIQSLLKGCPYNIGDLLPPRSN